MSDDDALPVVRFARVPLSDRERIEFLGAEKICAMVADGKSLKDIARVAGCRAGAISAYMGATPQTRFMLRTAREAAAWVYDERAEEKLTAATEPFALAQSRELAAHYRWRASKTAPEIYGDSQRVTLDATVSALTPDERRARIAQLQAKLGLTIESAIAPLESNDIEHNQTLSDL